MSSLVLPSQAFAQAIMTVPLPKMGSLISLSSPSIPVLIRGLKISEDHPFRFEFIIDAGDAGLHSQNFQEESLKLIKYFLVCLAVPEEDLWVNLSPTEKDRIIPSNLGTTQMGKDLLSQDYLLKKLTASLIYPDTETGKAFWQRIYQKAQATYGTTQIPINTFNKVWIVPSQAVVYEDEKAAWIVESRLKVMLEEEYIGQKDSSESSSITSPVIRDIILPAIEQEVNGGIHFAQLRQIYHSLILATWFKRNLRDSLFAKVYVEKNKLKGIDEVDVKVKEEIYEQYMQTFRKGVFNLIREEVDPATGQLIPRKYFSGGVAWQLREQNYGEGGTRAQRKALIEERGKAMADVTVDTLVHQAGQIAPVAVREVTERTEVVRRGPATGTKGRILGTALALLMVALPAKGQTQQEIPSPQALIATHLEENLKREAKEISVAPRQSLPRTEEEPPSIPDKQHKILSLDTGSRWMLGISTGLAAMALSAGDGVDLRLPLYMNMMVSGMAGSISSVYYRGHPLDGFLVGASAGTVMFAGKKIAIGGFSQGLGPVGRLVHSAGVSMRNNLVRGQGPFSRFETDVGPFLLSIGLFDSPDGFGIAVDPYSLSRVGVALAKGMSLDWEGVRKTGGLVFKSKAGAFPQDNPGGFAANIIFINYENYDGRADGLIRDIILGHELIHHFQYEAGGTFFLPLQLYMENDWKFPSWIRIEGGLANGLFHLIDPLFGIEEHDYKVTELEPKAWQDRIDTRPQKEDRGFIHPKGIEEEELEKIYQDIAREHREIEGQQKKHLAKVLQHLRDKVAASKIDENVQRRILEEIKVVERDSIVIFDRLIGIHSTEKYALATVLDDGPLAVIEGFFDGEDIGNNIDHQAEILFHEILNKIVPEKSHADHKARYETAASFEANRATIDGEVIEEFIGIARKVFGEDNTLKVALRNYVRDVGNVANISEDPDAPSPPLSPEAPLAPRRIVQKIAAVAVAALMLASPQKGLTQEMGQPPSPRTLIEASVEGQESSAQTISVLPPQTLPRVVKEEAEPSSAPPALEPLSPAMRWGLGALAATGTTLLGVNDPDLAPFLAFDVMSSMAVGAGAAWYYDTSMLDGTLMGATAGMTMFGGKKVMAETIDDGVAPVGKLLHSLGVSVRNNLVRGKGPFAVYETDFGPLLFQLRPFDDTKFGLAILVPSLREVMAVIQEDVTIDWRSSLKIGSLVFKDPALANDNDLGSTGVNLVFITDDVGPQYPRNIRDRTLAHEQVHVFQKEAWGTFTLPWELTLTAWGKPEWIRTERLLANEIVGRIILEGQELEPTRWGDNRGKDHVDQPGRLGFIHSKNVSEAELQEIYAEIAAKSRRLDGERREKVGEVLAHLRRKVGAASLEEGVRAKILEEINNLAVDSGSVVVFDRDVGWKSTEEYALATVLDDGALAVIEGFFSGEDIGNNIDHQAEILFHEILNKIVREKSHADHKARYETRDSYEVARAQGTIDGEVTEEFIGIARKIFGEDNTLKTALREYVQETSERGPEPDVASADFTKGGIDLNPERFLDIEIQGKKIEDFSVIAFENLNLASIEGITPIIIRITPFQMSRFPGR